MHILDYGGLGPDVVIIPGITSPAISLDFVAQRLTDICRPLIIDIRGRGLSDSGSTHTLDSYRDDLSCVVAELDLERPILVGHSMGARVAAALMVSAGKSLSGSVLVDPPLSGPSSGRYPTSLEAFERQLHEAYEGTTAAQVAAHWPRWGQRELELRALWLSSCDRLAVAQTHASFESVEFSPLWRELDSRSSLLFGGESAVVSVEAATRLAHQNPEPPIARVNAAGHMVFWDQPDYAVAALRKQISRIAAG